MAEWRNGNGRTATEWWKPGITQARLKMAVKTVCVYVYVVVGPFLAASILATQVTYSYHVIIAASSRDKCNTYDLINSRSGLSMYVSK